MEKSWTILEILKSSEEVLKNKNIKNPRLNAEILLSDTLNIKRIELYLNYDKPLNKQEIDLYKDKLKRRMNREPLQYIRGFTEFYGLRFNVNNSVLIPRQETELLVEKSIEIIKQFQNPRLIEIGTGSGCIAAAIGKNSVCTIDAIDIDENSLSLASENAALNCVQNINFIKRDIRSFSNFNDYDIVVSNPPYIPKKEFASVEEEVRNYEPHAALTDDSDGLTYYNIIFDLAINTGRALHLLLEIGDGKRNIVEKLLLDKKIKEYTFFKDLLNIDRVLHIKL
jgi:release factor glutamine methyltransferase